MFKFLVGIVVGGLIMFYGLPIYEDLMGPVKKPRMNDYFEMGENVIPERKSKFLPISSTEIRDQVQRNASGTQVKSAVIRIQTQSGNEQASRATIQLISELVDQQPELKPHIRERLDNGITNQEALEIFQLANL